MISELSMSKSKVCESYENITTISIWVEETFKSLGFFFIPNSALFWFWILNQWVFRVEKGFEYVLHIERGLTIRAEINEAKGWL